MKLKRKRAKVKERDTLLFEVLKKKCCYCKFNMSCDYRIPFCDLLEAPVEIGTKCPFWFKEILGEQENDE